MASPSPLPQSPLSVTQSSPRNAFTCRTLSGRTREMAACEGLGVGVRGTVYRSRVCKWIGGWDKECENREWNINRKERKINVSGDWFVINRNCDNTIIKICLPPRPPFVYEFMRFARQLSWNNIDAFDLQNALWSCTLTLNNFLRQQHRRCLVILFCYKASLKQCFLDYSYCRLAASWSAHSREDSYLPWCYTLSNGK
jgi:hypothetical protein